MTFFYQMFSLTQVTQYRRLEASVKQASAIQCAEAQEQNQPLFDAIKPRDIKEIGLKWIKVSLRVGRVCERTCHLPCVRFKGITLSLRAQSRLCLSTIENDHWEAVFFPITPSRAIVETFSLSFPILLMWCRAILGMMIFRGFHSFYCFHMWSYL